jgi:hypothetical protein
MRIWVTHFMSTTTHSPIIKGQAAQEDCLTFKDIENRKTGESWGNLFLIICIFFKNFFFCAAYVVSYTRFTHDMHAQTHVKYLP